jgi:signal transduction histidine kinase
VTFQRKLLVGFSLMVLPVLLVGAEAIRSNVLERRALDALGTNLTRTRTYAEVETAMFNQDEVIWRYLSGLEPEARHEYDLSGEVVAYWFDRWRAELRPDEVDLATNVERVQHGINAVADTVFQLVDAGHRDTAYALARRELKGRLLPILTDLNHEIYRRARQYSVQRAFARVQEIVDAERRALVGIMVLAVLAGLAGSWLISRSLARPIRDLQRAMAIVGAGDLDHPIHPSGTDEVSELGEAFAQMTARLRQSRADTERLNAQLAQQVKLASIGEMSAAVAHGLRNPLASLRAAAQLALRHPDSPAAREQLHAIIEEVDRLDRRISHLLSFSRPAPFHPSVERLPQLVESIRPAFVALARERGVTLDVALDPALPEIRVDPMQLEQAIVEVISNALDAMPSGGTLTLRAASDGGTRDVGEIVLSIADSGTGIPPHVLASVGEPFFTTRPEGTGLGLATARRYVEQNGGRLELTSEPGRGTTVRFHLPLAAAAAASGHLA